MTKNSKYLDYVDFLNEKSDSVSDFVGEKCGQRLEIENQMAEFLANGGVVQEFAPGATADPDTRAFRRGKKNV